MKMETTIGKRIAALRKERNLKQDELAEMLNVSPQAVSKWENDQTCPDINLLPKLADIFGVSIDELFREKEEEVSVKLLSLSEIKKVDDMMLRIIVNSADGDRVRVNLPVVLIKTLMEMGMGIPDVVSGDALKKIDFNKIFELVEKGVVGSLVEVDSADGDKVRIFVE